MNRIGKVVGGQVYIHVEVLDSLEAKKQSLVRLAESAAQVTANEQYNVVRVALDGTGVALLNYPTFFEEAFPALAGSWKYYPDTKDVRFRDYSRSLNPPILHRKELLISELHPRLREFKTLTQSAEQLGLFSDSTRIGFASYWHKSIRDLGYEIVGHTLRPTDRINPPQARTSKSMVASPPRRLSFFSCNTRSNLACNCMGISPISSKKMVPPWACSNKPL